MTPTGRLIVVCGLPGSGKTTVARLLERERGAVRMNADDWLAALGLSLWDTPTEDLWEHIQRRALEDPPVTRRDLEAWVELFEAPDDAERALFDPS